MKLAGLQAYTTARKLDLPPSARQLHQLLRKELRKASDTGAILDTPTDVFRLVELLSEPPPNGPRGAAHTRAAPPCVLHHRW